jgi:type I restriction enzyme S subunit
MSKLVNYVEILLGGTPATNRPDFWDGEIPWVSIVDFANAKKIYTTEKTITEAGLRQSNTKLLHEGDVIVSARGTVGKIVVCGKRMAFNQSCYALSTKDKNKLSQNYLFYLLQEKIKYLRQMAVGGVFNTIIKSTLEKIPIELPDIDTQEEIASILSSYDNLIDNNRRRIQLLEESARLLFREWFVYFRFPLLRQGFGGQAGHEKACPVESRNSTGVKIIDGVPEGWKKCLLGDFAEIRKGKNITFEQAIEGDIPVVGGGLGPTYYHNKANVSSPVITISASGANAGHVNLYDTDIWASDCSYINKNSTKYIFSLYLRLKNLQTAIFGY